MSTGATLSIWTRCGGAVVGFVCRVFRLDRSAELDKRTDRIWDRLEKRLEVVEVDLDECRTDRANLHAKCDSLAEDHESCKETTADLTATVEELRRKVESQS